MRKTRLSPLCLSLSLSLSLPVSVSVSLCVSDSLSHTQASKLSNLKGIREWKLLPPKKKEEISIPFRSVMH